MAQGVNRVLVIGNLTRDPDLRYTSGAEPTAVLGMRLAVNGREKRNGVWEDRADYFDVRVWGNQAEACSNYLTKGSPVAVDGRLRLEEWEDKDTRAKRSRVLIVADKVQFLRSGSGGGGGHESASFVPGGDDVDFAADAGGNVDFPTGTDDDIPF